MPSRNFKYLYYFFWYANDKGERFRRPSAKLLMILFSLIVKNFLQLWRLFLFQEKQYKQTKKKKKNFSSLTLRTLRAETVVWFPDCQLWFAVSQLSCAIPQRKYLKRVFLPHERVSSHTARRF